MMLLVFWGCVTLAPPCDGEPVDAFSDADGDGHGAGTAVSACPGLAGWSTTGDDCDDDDAAAFPGSAEVPYDGVDQDCDGEDRCDDDLDGSNAISCGGDDCDDTDGSVGPDTVEQWYDGVDGDCAGDGDYDQDGDGVDSERHGGDDCDDEDPGVQPSADDTPYDGVDSDCDGANDYDQDGDGYVSDEYAALAGLPGGDCDDANAAVSAGAAEVCDGADNNCDGGVDEGFDMDGDLVKVCDGDCDDTDGSVQPGATDVWYDGRDVNCDEANDYDQDGDAWVPLEWEAEAGLPGGDCDDTDPAVNPEAAEEWYDDLDANCDGLSDFDQDADGYESDDFASGSADDCNDTDPVIHPDGLETPYDGIDQDCDGADLVDVDGDGHEAATVGGDDCDDNAASTHPGASDGWYDGVDANCDGADDYDRDGDGYSSDDYAVGSADDCDDNSAGAHPGAAETPYDEIDQDCDGVDLVDVDGDGHDGEVAGGDDCEDTDAGTYPGAADAWYDGTDADCDRDSDYDQDADGYESDAYASGSADDCNDTDPVIHPDGLETPYDGIDQDCDGADLVDVDSDGHDAESVGGDDCDDNLASTQPGAADAWYDGVDANCDGADDYDRDGDGYTSDAFASGSADDCDDVDSTVHPAATDAWYDGEDTNCDGASDYDQDADGYDTEAYTFGTADDCDDTDASTNPGEPDVLDGADQDCSATADDPAAGDVAVSSIYGGTNDAAGSGGVLLVDDLDGDGEDELVAASGAVDADSGAVWLFGPTELSAVNTVGDAWLTLTGGTGDEVGGSIVAGLDWNADGQLEVGAAAPGRSVVYLTEPASTSGTRGASAVAWATLSGTAGTSFGEAVAYGDLDGDGIDDLCVGAPAASSGKGTVYVFLGDSSAASKTAAAADYSVPGADSGDAIGSVLASGGDPSGDGIEDLAVGVPDDDENGRPGSGSVFLVVGSAVLTNPLSLSIETLASWTMTGSATSQAVGTAVSFGDVASTTYADILVGATGYSWSGGTGGMGIFYGGVSGAESFSAADRLVQAAGAGTAVAGGDDLDGDGTADLLLGASGESITWMLSLAGTTGTLQLPGSQVASWSGEADDLGSRVDAHARDIDGDSVLEVVLAAPADDGVVYVLNVFP